MPKGVQITDLHIIVIGNTVAARVNTAENREGSYGIYGIHQLV